jgi:hypothetical protein
MITRIITAAFVALLFTPVMPALAGDHPEHPQGGPPPSMPATTGRNPQPTAAAVVSKGDISAGIKKNIASDSKKTADKKFHTKYKGKDLALDLIKVHDDRVSNLGGGKYFACVDMKATDGTVYDIDFFLTGNPGNMAVTETTVHKINGKPLYNWKEVGGVWKKVSA